jgi:hypothetical protein
MKQSSGAMRRENAAVPPPISSLPTPGVAQGQQSTPRKDLLILENPEGTEESRLLHIWANRHRTAMNGTVLSLTLGTDTSPRSA